MRAVRRLRIRRASETERSAPIALPQGLVCPSRVWTDEWIELSRRLRLRRASETEHSTPIALPQGLAYPSRARTDEWIELSLYSS